MKILVIRRDNIGDLVCTTPLLGSLRRQLPHAQIEVLVTRYNRAVLADNPDIDALYAYTKAKHRMRGESLLGIYAQRAAMMMELRRRRFDWALLPGGANASAARFARWIAPRHVISEVTNGVSVGPHEVERCCALLTRMGLEYETPPARVVADDRMAAALRGTLEREGGMLPRRLIALHISARKPSQRWPAERFGELARRLHASDERLAFMLLWAPGTGDNQLHPGDDEKVAGVLAAAGDAPISPVPTTTLDELIAALSLCDLVICGDGGAMHLAAGLGKPIVALFGQSDIARWRPWGVPQRVLQKPSLDVRAIAVEEVEEAVGQLSADLAAKKAA